MFYRGYIFKWWIFHCQMSIFENCQMDGWKTFAYFQGREMLVTGSVTFLIHCEPVFGQDLMLILELLL